MRKIYLATVFGSCFIISDALTAQVNTFNSNSIPNANIATYTKLIENSANTFNGSINLEIPIDSIDLGNITIPINLKYNTSGIKVQEEAGIVGLGWNLDIGGFVNQNIIGSIDKRIEYSDIFSYNNNHPENPIYPPTSVYGHWGFVRDPTVYAYSEPIYILRDPGCGLYNHYGVDELDFGKGQPDIFYFKFLNYSGKFFIDYSDNSINRKHPINTI